jgi:hypothetical protein
VVRVTKTIAESRLGDVPQGKQFWCQDGRVLKRLPQLGVALKQMDEETFRRYSSESRNDFSNWVKDVIGD